MTSATASPLQQVLAAVGGTTKPSRSISPPAAPERVLGLDDELTVFVLHLELVLSRMIAVGLPGQPLAIMRLSTVHDEAVALQSRAFDTWNLGRTDADRLAARIHRGAEALQIAAKPLVNSAHLAVKSQYLAATQVLITPAATDIMTAYAQAVVDAWTTGKPATGTLNAADLLLAKFPGRVLDKYFQFGLDETISEIVSKRNTLAALIAQFPLPATPPPAPSYGDVVIDHIVDHAWDLGSQLTSAVTDVRNQFPAGNAAPSKAAQAALAALLRRFQAFEVTLTGLIVDQQLAMLIDASILPLPAVGRMKDDRTALDAALADVHAGFMTGNQQFADGATAIANLVGSAQFKTDIDDAIDDIQYTQMAKSIALSAMIVAAAAFTGGIAAGAAEAAITAFGAETLGSGVAVWASMGGFAADVMTFTLVDRTGKQLLFGSDSIAGTSFGEDLFWNAVTMGSLKLVGEGYGTLFREGEAKGFRFWAGKFAVDQISLFAIGQIQRATQSTSTSTMSDTGREIASQIAMGILLELGGVLRTSVRDRLGVAANAVNAANLAAAEAGAVALGEQLDLIKTMNLVEIDAADLAAKSEQQFNMVLDLVKSLPDGAAGKDQAYVSLQVIKMAIELHLARARMDSSLSGKDAQQTVAPGGTNVVVATDAAVPLIDKVLTAEGGSALTDSTVIEDVKVSTNPNGDLTVVVPVETISSPPIPPSILVEVSLLLGPLGLNDSDVPVALADHSPMAAQGLANLCRARADGTTRSEEQVLGIIGDAPKPERIGFLTFLSHPEFEDPDAFSKADLKWFAKIAGAREFGNQYGPELTNTVRRKMFAKSAVNRKKLLSAYQIGRAEIEATAAGSPERATVLDTLSQRTGPQWNALAAGGPALAKLPKPTSANYGIDQESTQWNGLRARIEQWYPNAQAHWSELTDIEQIMERGRGTDYLALSPVDRRTLLRGFIDKCEAAGLPATDVSGKFGALAERLFLPNARKEVFYQGKSGYGPKTKGASKPDDYDDSGLVPLFLEFKANRLYDLIKMTPAEAKARARQHRIDMSGDFDENGVNVKEGDVVNMRPTTEFNLWYIFDPSPNQRAEMIEALSAHRSKVTRVKFGFGNWVTITPRTAPDPTKD